MKTFYTQCKEYYKACVWKFLDIFYQCRTVSDALVNKKTFVDIAAFYGKVNINNRFVRFAGGGD